MNLTNFAFANRRLVALVTVVLLLTGFVSYLNFPSKEDPEVTVREAVVAAYFPGMSPERVENLITRKLEKQIRLIPEIEHIKNVMSTTGMSILHVKVYDQFFEMEPIWQNLRNKMRDVQRNLPEGTLGPFVDDEFGDTFGITVALTADGFDYEAMRKRARHLRDRLYTVAGTRKVVLHGVQRERVFLKADNARLAEYGISADEIARTLQTQNVILPGGTVRTDGGLLTVIEPTGNFENVEAIESTVIELPRSQGVAYLGDIFEVERAYIDPPESKTYFNGRPAIVVAASMMKGGVNVLEWSPRIATAVREYEAELPIGFKLDIATYQAEQVAASVQGVAINLYETLAIVGVVVMLILGVRTGLIVGAMIPATMLVSLVVMRVLGIELQRVSLATMIIALGLLVDNGIVMAEEIRRRMMEGEDRKDAAIGAGQSLALPLLTSSLTTILAFLPLALAPDSSGEYLTSMTMVIAIALLSSWLLAVTVTPLMCWRWMKLPDITPEEAKAKFEAPVYQRYQRMLEGVLRHRTVFVGSVMASLVAAVFLMDFVPQQFFPNSSRNQYMIYVDLPAQYGIHATDAEVQGVLDWLNDSDKNPEVVSNVAYVGEGGPRFFVPLAPRDPSPNTAFILVTVEDSDSVAASVDRTRRYLFEEHPNLLARIKRFWLGNSETGLVEVRIVGPDADTLFGIGEEVAGALRDIPGTVDIFNDWRNRVTKVVVNVDQPQARRRHLTSQDISDSLYGFFSGIRVTEYREGDSVIPVQLRGGEEARHDLTRVETANVYSTAAGTNVPLLEVATLEPVNQFSQIMRRDLERTVTISAKHAWLQAADVEASLLPTLREIAAKMPPGYRWEFGGESADAAKANTALGTYLPHAFAAMVLLMVWQFNSYAKPAIIFITIPLCFSGAVLGLLATGAYFGFMAILGLLSLAGIIINNAIVLIETTQNLIDDEGLDPYAAAVRASVTRLQPVMMTTLTTILGLFTLMLPPDPLFFGMAVVIAAGLAGGTLLTLVAVPVFYTLFFRVPIPAR